MKLIVVINQVKQKTSLSSGERELKYKPSTVASGDAKSLSSGERELKFTYKGIMIGTQASLSSGERELKFKTCY